MDRRTLLSPRESVVAVETAPDLDLAAELLPLVVGLAILVVIAAAFLLL